MLTRKYNLRNVKGMLTRKYNLFDEYIKRTYNLFFHVMQCGADDYWVTTTLPLLAVYRVQHALVFEIIGFCLYPGRGTT
jgi:hypothetical protein